MLECRFVARLRKPAMAQHRLAGAWDQVKQSAKREWGHLPDGRFEELEHRRLLFVSLFQIFHGKTRQDAEREIDQWSATTDQPAPASRGRSWWPWKRRV
jgi:uncharacterized protein YjbJ (UPF0337 family)